MKRIVICYDGTWNALTNPDEVTNVVRVAQAVKSVASDGITQMVYYNAGVGSGGPLDRLLGGVFGAGLRDSVKRGLAFLALNWDPEEPGNPVADEIYIFGFSRGAYSARALAGVIGAIQGIPRQSSFDQLEKIWDYYRKSKEEREREKADIDDLIYKMPAEKKPIIKCVGVWDTVGRYGIPAGLGLGALARQATAWTRGFSNNAIGDHIELGLHAMAIDEWRRSFSATAWVTDQEAGRPGVEQVWFAGAHSNVGGGYRRAGLSDLALIWMIARVGELTKLEFDNEYVQTHFWPCAACSLYRSNRGLLGGILSGFRSYLRPIPEAIRAAGQSIMPATKREHILNPKVHWSVKDRLGRLGLVDEIRYRKYRPRNVPENIDVAPCTPRERELIELCRRVDHKRRKNCALYGDPPQPEAGWRGWWQGWRTRRLRQLRQSWEDASGGRT
jgi:Uncharacterized alpha/beta hydrolase domain (DUF2235)